MARWGTYSGCGIQPHSLLQASIIIKFVDVCISRHTFDSACGVRLNILGYMAMYEFLIFLCLICQASTLPTSHAHSMHDIQLKFVDS